MTFRYRYSEWDGTQDIPSLDPDDLLASITDDLMNFGDLQHALRNLLQRGLSGVAEQVAILAEAAGAIDPAVNFRLDAHDRQLRGLRSRLRDRQERIRRVLQAEADRAARVERDGQERRLRAVIGASDDQRQALMDTLVANLRRLRELDQRHQELRGLSAELKAEDGAVARLTERLEQLEAERPELRRDVVTLVDSRYEQTTGRHRIRNAGLAGAATFAAAGLLFLLMFAQRPRRTGAARTGADGDPALP